MRRCVSASLRRVASKPVFSARAPDFHTDADARKYPAAGVNLHETEATSVDVRPELHRRPRFSYAVHFFRMDRHAQDARAFEPWINGLGLAVLPVMTLKLIFDG
jgi:hypothetical protein